MKEVLVDGHSKRGRPLGRCKNKVKEYMCERGASRWSQEERKTTWKMEG